MIFGILAAVIMVPFFATVSWIIAYERREHTIRPWYQYTYNGSNSQTESPARYSQLISLDKVIVKRHQVKVVRMVYRLSYV